MSTKNYGETLPVTLISTVFNEGKDIRAFLDSILKSTRLPSEFIVVDAGSRDGTGEIVSSFAPTFVERGVRLRLEVAPGVNIARGRNIAFQLATNENVVTADAGTLVDPDWFEKVALPLLEGHDMVGGYYYMMGRGLMDHAIAILSQPPSEINERNFIPSSRSMGIRKELWKKAGGYPEELSLCGEDTAFAKRAIALSDAYRVVLDATVRWDLPDTRGMLRKLHFYAVGDGEAGQEVRAYARIAFRFVAMVAFVFVAFAFFGVTAGVICIMATICLVAAYLGRRVQAHGRRIGLASLMALAIFKFSWDVVAIVGYVRGALRR